MKKYITLFMIVFLAACSSSNTAYPSASIETPAPTIDEVKQPIASGTKVATDNELVQIDYSNVNDGYFQVKTVSDDHRGLIVLVVKDDQQYRYDINDDYIYETFPINMGSGEYKVKVGENIEDNRYAIILTVSFSVTLVDDVIPFLYPNQVIDFDIDSSAVSLSFGLTEDAKSQLERVYVIYHYIIDNIDYDFGKLEAARSSYILPIIDETLASKKGICFDYASLMSAMLRVQQIPTKVITGYVDDGYHSWVEVYIDGEGGSLTGTETITVEEGTLFSEVVIPTPVAAEGYEFDAWTPVLPADATEITEDLSFVANFNEVEEIVEPDTPETPEVAAEGCWIHWLMLLLTLVYGLYEGIRLNKKEEYAQKGGNK